MFVTFTPTGATIDTNSYQIQKGAVWSGSSTDPALAAANPGPVPTDRPIMGQGKNLLLWVGKAGQATIQWNLSTSAALDTAIEGISDQLVAAAAAVDMAADGTVTLAA